MFDAVTSQAAVFLLGFVIGYFAYRVKCGCVRGCTLHMPTGLLFWDRS